MKKTILIVLVVVLLFAFAGCGATTYKVTFDTDGGSAVETQTVKEGEKAVRPAEPTKTVLCSTIGIPQRLAARFSTLTWR